MRKLGLNFVFLIEDSYLNWFKVEKFTILLHFFFDTKIHKQVEKLRRRPFLQLSETQFTGLQQRRPPPEIAARWRCIPLIKKMRAHYNSQLESAFIIVSTGKPKDAYKWVYIGPEPIRCCFQKSLVLTFFIPSWSTKRQYLVDNLLCQPQLYLPPLLGFLKWIECLGMFGEPHPIYGDLCGPKWFEMVWNCSNDPRLSKTVQNGPK